MDVSKVLFELIPPAKKPFLIYYLYEVNMKTGLVYKHILNDGGRGGDEPLVRLQYKYPRKVVYVRGQVAVYLGTSLYFNPRGFKGFVDYDKYGPHKYHPIKILD